ncbi:hypothetical protein KP509_39G031000 [Ceratopteris richardii]|uniref:Peptidase A1 domain-containing protein n=1 Tax=Ceratopteris richardii TaxID=49495 RepID=A0A8T2Q075_CERRI|nr:hypothetical protein KP509_39G031000 [Ceratopteris richardii]KAH7277036.1 hypothetical protein KP509_39G031000 [Ceratopteris richardii]
MGWYFFMHTFLLALVSVILLVPECSLGTSGATRRLLAELRKELGTREGAITLPVYHRSSRNGDFGRGSRGSRSTLDISDLGNLGKGSILASNESAPPPTAQTSIVNLDQSFGQFFAVFKIGTPPTDLALIIDTGSQLLWIQCEPCNVCGIQARGYKVFNPNTSGSFSFLSCSIDTSCPGDDSVSTACGQDGRCIYHVTYGDKSNSSGYLATENLAAGTTTLRGASNNQNVFGCGYVNEGIEAQLNASGLLGLDRGPFSLISQLGIGVFAHCLPNRIKSTDVSGYLRLGSSKLNSSIALSYTPMIQNNASAFYSQFYHLSMTGITVDGKLLDIPSSAFEISPEGDAGGTIIDSGTTLTSFVEEAFSVVEAAFSVTFDQLYKRYDTGSLGLLCYQVPLSQEAAPKPPSVVLHFENNLDIDLPAQHVLRYIGRDTSYNYYCMAFKNSGSLESGGRNFIGNFQLQDYLVEYDIANSRIGFAPQVCGTEGSSSDARSLQPRMWLLWDIFWTVPTVFMVIL